MHHSLGFDMHEFDTIEAAEWSALTGRHFDVITGSHVSSIWNQKLCLGQDLTLDSRSRETCLRRVSSQTAHGYHLPESLAILMSVDRHA